MKDKNLQKAIKLSGGVASLAKQLGISSQAVSQWSSTPVKHCPKIEKATSGAVTRADLRPDIFGPIDNAA